MTEFKGILANTSSIEIKNSLSLPYMQGEVLDVYAEYYGVKRIKDESDECLKARLKLILEPTNRDIVEYINKCLPVTNNYISLNGIDWITTSNSITINPIIDIENSTVSTTSFIFPSVIENAVVNKEELTASNKVEKKKCEKCYCKK